MRLAAVEARRLVALAAGVAGLAVVGCLDSDPQTPARFPCPDLNCPIGLSCVAGFCQGGGGSTSGGSTSAGSSLSSTGAGSSSGGTTASSSNGGGASSNGTGGGSSNGGSSGGGSSGASSGTSGGGGPGNFAGEWDMDVTHVSLVQDGGVVTGRYHDWGYTYADPTLAGTISGSVQGNVFTGTFQDNTPTDAAVPLTWTLSQGQLNGNYQPAGAPAYPWCGVAAGQGTPLPDGCGWSGLFVSGFSSQGAPLIVSLNQVADQVSGIYAGGVVSGGVVSDHRFNGQYAKPPGSFIGRFSFSMTPDENQFTGNYINGTNLDFCAYREFSAATALPNPCFGGGGFYDGTWFTNLGTLTLTQTPPSSNPVTGVWFFWGSDIEYPLTGTVTLVDAGTDPAGASTRYALSWTDDSPLQGAVHLTSVPGSYNGMTIQGVTAGPGDGGDLWCGVIYGPNPFVASPLPDAGVIGSLYPGCGLTSNAWTLSGAPAPGSTTAQLVQTRGVVTGFTGSGASTFSGVLGPNPLLDAGVGTWVAVTGTWSNPPVDTGTFSWYPDGQDQTFSGDFSGSAAGAWCGSETGSLPNPCEN